MTEAKKSNEYIMSVIVLAAICLVVAVALACVNYVTAPVIEDAAIIRAENARMEVLPEADQFTLLELDGLPACVTEVYKAENGAGYVFMLVTKGYGGDMELICGIDGDGLITACKTLSHSETKGLGAKTADDPYRSQYEGEDASLSGVEAISGATISSNAYKTAIQDAFAAYELVKEVA